MTFINPSLTQKHKRPVKYAVNRAMTDSVCEKRTPHRTRFNLVLSAKLPDGYPQSDFHGLLTRNFALHTGRNFMGAPVKGGSGSIYPATGNLFPR
jgi:hypothetical protein